MIRVWFSITGVDHGYPWMVEDTAGKTVLDRAPRKAENVYFATPGKTAISPDRNQVSPRGWIEFDSAILSWQGDKATISWNSQGLIAVNTVLHDENP